jgi:hypothetical protein
MRIHRYIRIVLGIFFLSALQIVSAQPPPPSQVPPNASLISAIVVDYTEWPVGSFTSDTLPSLSPDEVHYSVKLMIETSEKIELGLGNLAVPETTYEAFSEIPLSTDFIGKKIRGVLKLTGSTLGVRWWLTDVQEISE